MDTEATMPVILMERRCKATRIDGEPCRRFADWGDDRCSAHGGVKTKKRAICTCSAYSFPHRPGGGSCRYEIRYEPPSWYFGEG